MAVRSGVDKTMSKTRILCEKLNQALDELEAMGVECLSVVGRLKQDSNFNINITRVTLALRINSSKDI